MPSAIGKASRPHNCASSIILHTFNTDIKNFSAIVVKQTAVNSAHFDAANYIKQILKFLPILWGYLGLYLHGFAIRIAG